ncbi:MAG: lysozyme [Rhizobiales bacterium]|nr:lysozyme [Hyphomicrobiales bacterium]OJX99110.1 MAG: glycoside hydrolase [Rhizobiales bacterium 63-22]
MASKRAKAAIAAAVAAGVASPGVYLAKDYLIKPWEATKLVAYRDIAGVVTACTGETKGIKMGMRFTKEQCDHMLDSRVENDFHKPLTRCIAGFDKKPISWQAAMISLSYNVGVGTACNSTAAALARSNRMADSCQAITRFNRAGGRIIKGLINRRGYGDETRIGELELCLAGLN